jgi:VWFA-related protein
MKACANEGSLHMKKLGFLFATLIAFGQAPEAPAVFTTGTNSVLVDTAVTGDRRLIEGLQREDFVLLENGQPRTIAGIEHDELPLDIVLVCQVPLRGPNGVSVKLRNDGTDVPPPSASDLEFHQGGFALRNENTPQRLMNAAANAVLGARPGDRFAMVSYGRDPRIELRFTDNRKAIAGAIKRFDDPANADENIVVSSEALAIEYAVRMLADVERNDPNARTSRRRLIVLISNIYGVGTRYADEPIIRRLWDQNIVLSVIDDAAPTASTKAVQHSSGGESQTILFRRYNPIHIAQATGGDRIVAVDQDQGAPQHPLDLLTPLRQRYTLWFNQPSDVPPGESRTIKLALSEAARRRFPDAVVKAREGYVTR